MIDVNLIPLAAIGLGFIIAITSILSSTISKHKLKVEQIKADALVRAEEIRAKNQLELEKLLRQEQRDTGKTGGPSDESSRDYNEDRNIKSRVRE